MGKIAISSDAPGLDSAVDPRFGRAAGFVVVDTETQETTYIDNGASQVMAQGAGIQAATVVVSAGATVVLTGYVGPKAFQALSAVGIEVVQDLGDMTIREALDKYQAGEIVPATGPNRRGHWK